jgi:hypothetical protein
MLVSTVYTSPRMLPHEEFLDLDSDDKLPVHLDAGRSEEAGFR